MKDLVGDTGVEPHATRTVNASASPVTDSVRRLQVTDSVRRLQFADSTPGVLNACPGCLDR
ncbi:hypothetical protein ACFVTC_20890 [Streptomyces sp. NPDC057950]|uniref:hypothetical protein n=1 Tax=Streptomyces sp. NPDC057950 TaxID=3346288 RepID=UPI0036F09048